VLLVLASGAGREIGFTGVGFVKDAAAVVVLLVVAFLLVGLVVRLVLELLASIAAGPPSVGGRGAWWEGCIGWNGGILRTRTVVEA
jgi:hypothetical protein